MILEFRGFVHIRTGRFDDALALFHQSMEIMQRLGRKRGVALRLNQIGAILTKRGEFDEATAALTRAEGLLLRVNDRRTLARTLQRLGHAQLFNGDRVEAERTLRRSLELCREWELWAYESEVWELLSQATTDPDVRVICLEIAWQKQLQLGGAHAAELE